jgi:hypothetical protein
MANALNYSNVALQTTLAGNISSGALSINVGLTTGFPSAPFVLALDYGAATEELVLVTAPPSGTTLTVTRGYGGTSAQSHSIGAVVRHVYNAQDAVDFRTHEASTGAVHGLTGSIVGTSDVQSLSNKTLTSPTINAGTLTGTFAGSHTLTGTVTHSGATNLNAGGALAGTFTGAPTLSGNVAFSGSPTFSGSPGFTGTPTFSGPVTFSGVTTAATVTGELAMQNLLRGTRANITDSMYEARKTGDPNARWFMQANGLMAWGPGTTGIDVNLGRTSAGLLETSGSFKADGDLIVSGVGQRLWAVKAADTNRATTTLSNDPDLTFTVVAGATYRLTGLLSFMTTDPTNAKLNMGFSVPAGSSGSWTMFAQGNNTGSVNAGQIRTVVSNYSTFRTYDAITTDNLGGMVDAYLTTTNSGTFALQWARAAAAGTTTMSAGSCLVLTRVA